MTTQSADIAPVVMYSTQFCPYCVRARMLLKSRQIPYTDISVDGNAERRQEMTEKSGRKTVPQIWIGSQHVGGYDDLAALHTSGKLDALLTSQKPG